MVKKEKVVKQVFYKQVFFWLFVVSVIFNLFFLIAIVGLSGKINKLEYHATNQGTTTKNVQQENKVEENNKPQKLKMNEELSLISGDKETAKIKIVEATTNQSAFPSHMISLDEYDTKKMVAVKIDYTNVAMKEPFLPYANYFQAYDENGKALKQVSQQNGQDAVSSGRTGTTQLFWELSEDGNNFNKFELDFITDKKLGTFDLNVSH